MSGLTIVGASARAAAASARRAGLVPWTADLFTDADLRAMVPGAVRCPAGRYPRALVDILRDGPPGPWMYTGGLENHPNLVGRMAAVRPLWGNGPEALAACRSPFNVARILRDAGVPALEVRSADAGRRGHHSWLRKPLAGSAGQGITFAGPQEATPDPGRRRRWAQYYQEFVSGVPMSAVFVRARGDVRLLGMTEQLIGVGWLNAPPFRYAGNIGPVDPPPELLHHLLRIGRVLSERCGLLGLFGVDFVLNGGRPWVVEVNPRYPASVEVLERATGVAALALHRTAFDPDASPSRPGAPGPAVVGKAIVYAPRPLIMPRNGSADDRSWVADVPAAGEAIEKGRPVLTVFAEADRRDECLAELMDRVGRVRRGLFGGEPSES